MLATSRPMSKCELTAWPTVSQEAELLAAREGRKGNSQLYYIDYSLLKPGAAWFARVVLIKLLGSCLTNRLVLTSRHGADSTHTYACPQARTKSVCS
jgi:hypothetical protein